MSKLLLFGLLGVVVYLILRDKRKQEVRAAEARPVQQMVVCAQCGVHLPESDSLQGGAEHYCCEQHRELGPGPLARRR